MKIRRIRGNGKRKFAENYKTVVRSCKFRALEMSRRKKKVLFHAHAAAVMKSDEGVVASYELRSQVGGRSR